MFQKILNSLERRIGRYRGIRNLISLIVAAMAAVYVADLFAPTVGFYLSSWLAFDRAAILRGQVWRLITFVVTPPNVSFVFIIFQLLFLHFTGDMLQNHWGTLRFNLFYLFGVVGSICAGMITGYATSYYINLSIFLAVAILYPNMEVNIYGILPVKLKWLALLDVLFILPGLIQGGWGERLAIIVSLLNVVLFFYDRFIRSIKDAKRRYEWKKNWRSGNWR